MVHRPPAEKPRFSLSETFLVLIIGASLIGGIYGMISMLKRNDRAAQAITTLAYIQQNLEKASGEDNTDPWGNPVAIVAAPANFSVTYNAVPQGACKYIAKNFDRTSPSFVSLSINSTVFRESAEEINAETVAAACAENENAMMIWTFSRSVTP